MAFALFYLIVSLLLFYLAQKKNGDSYLMFMVTLAFTMCGTLNEDMYKFIFLMPHEWVIAITLGLLLLMGMAKRRRYVFAITWIDKLFLFYLVTAILIPFLANMYQLYITTDHVLSFFLPIKIWMVFRIFFYLLSEKKIQEKTFSTEKKFDFFLKAFVIISLLSATVGVLRYVEIPFLTRFVDDSWPVYYNGIRVAAVYGRLTGTMSAENGTGLFFAVSVMSSLYLYNKYRKQFYLFSIAPLYFVTILSGSVSSNLTLLIALSIFIKRHFGVRLLGRLVLVCLILFIFFLGILSNKGINSSFITMLENRYDYNYGRSAYYSVSDTMLPAQLVGRYDKWVRYWDYFLEKPVFGYSYEGAGSMDRHFTKKGGIVAENFYVRLLIYSGIFGLLGYLVLNWTIIRRLSKIITYPEQSFFIKLFIGMILVSQISQLSFQYGGISELFGIMSAFVLSFSEDRFKMMKSQIVYTRLHTFSAKEGFVS